MNRSMGPPAEDSSLEENYRLLKRDIAARLRNACSGWAPEEFEDLVEKATRIAMKYPQPPGEISHNRST